jgi:hypothetical protein
LKFAVFERLVYPLSRDSRSRTLADPKPINWQNALTIVSVAILVGTELVGVSWAAGWALGGLMGLPPWASLAFEIAGGLFGMVLVYYFVRAALKVEPLRG